MNDNSTPMPNNTTPDATAPDTTAPNISATPAIAQSADNTFDPQNPRVRLAKFKRHYNNPVFTTFAVLIIIVLLAGGIALLFLHQNYSRFGWLLIGFAAIPAIMLFWAKNALASIPIGKNNTFTDLLAEDLLLLLKPSTTPTDLITLLAGTSSGSFLMARFGLTVDVLNQVANLLPATPEPVYQLARELCPQTSSEQITGAVLAVALVMSLPDYEQFLAGQQLSVEDLKQGIIWNNYLTGLVADSKRLHRSGGIGRDLSFGYTPTLQRFAIDLSSRYANARTRIPQADHSRIISQIVEIFTHGGRQNVALVGTDGCGRSTLVGALAEKLMNPDSTIPRDLQYRQLYSLDAPSLISAAKNPSDLERLLLTIFNEIYSAKNIILCLENAHLFFEEGPGSIDISGALLPVLEAGSIRLILVMDEQKFLEISAKNPALANLLNKITVTPSNREETLQILMDQAPLIEYQKNVIFSYRALTEAYRLSDLYIHDMTMPGKAKLLLESSASFAFNRFVTAESVASAVESAYGVKVKVSNDAEDRDRLLNLETLIHERMVDQVEAVTAVSSALRRAAAGVKNTGRPIGTFLFLGPTGVGKTELAKTLSEVYFGGEGNLVRLDMNEFVTAEDVGRLIADGADDALSLTAQISKHPFSVILLDEIEKAHSSVLTTLLQVLDEGILRDSKNREISFRDSIIIATSNAGANDIREKITAGAEIAQLKDEIIDSLISSGEFKPEFLNRFDEVCLFKPLSKEDLVQVLDIIIAGTNKTLEPQKISVELDDGAKQALIDQGYDPKMGARPMRRVVQKAVEDVVASAILSGSATPGTTLHITADQVKAS